MEGAAFGGSPAKVAPLGGYFFLRMGIPVFVVSWTT